MKKRGLGGGDSVGGLECALRMLIRSRGRPAIKHSREANKNIGTMLRI